MLPREVKITTIVYTTVDNVKIGFAWILFQRSSHSPNMAPNKLLTISMTFLVENEKKRGAGRGIPPSIATQAWNTRTLSMDGAM